VPTIFCFNITLKKKLLRYLYSLFFFLFVSLSSRSQIRISGHVVDISRQNYVPFVRVESTGGLFAITDSVGQYSILVNEHDSLNFVYKNKSTQKFAVKAIANPAQFDISLRVPVESKYSVLKEVIVYSKTYREDSLENRKEYADIFDYQKPGLSTGIGPGGIAGADVNELINIFRFKRNRNIKSFQRRLENQEQEKYIDYRFNALHIKRTTGISGVALDSFMRWYRPSYEFAANSSEIAFNQYILNASYQFNKIWARKEE